MESLDEIEAVFANVDDIDYNFFDEPRSRKVYRRDVDPFYDFSEESFKKRFRFSKNVVQYVILPKICASLQSETERGLPINPMGQLLTALRFFATGSFQIVSGDFMHISQSTVCIIVKRVSRALCQLMPEFIKFPADLRETKTEFEELGCIERAPGLKNIIGAIDCTHIQIKKPRGIIHTEQYRNRKGYFSLNVQVVGDAKLRIQDIVVRWAGSTHDSRILRNSRLNVRLNNNELDGILLGDGGYPCTRYLLTPITNPRSLPEERYNKAQIKTRNSVERLFGLWKRRFPCLQIGLATKLSTTANIIVACAVLHNIAIEVRDNLDEDDEINPAPNTSHLPNTTSTTSTNDGLVLRANIVTTLLKQLTKLLILIKQQALKTLTNGTTSPGSLGQNRKNILTNIVVDYDNRN